MVLNFLLGIQRNLPRPDQSRFLQLRRRAELKAVKIMQSFEQENTALQVTFERRIEYLSEAENFLNQGQEM